jgi:hypothetical protein
MQRTEQRSRCKFKNIVKSDPVHSASISSACTLLYDEQDTPDIFYRSLESEKEQKTPLKGPQKHSLVTFSARHVAPNVHASDRLEYHPGSHSHSLAP